MKEDRKKALKAFKEREEVGGLYRIRNTQTGWESPLCATPNLGGMRNRLQFAQKTNTNFDTMLKSQWEVYGPHAFSFVVVEELVKKPEQTTAEFREELAALLALHEEAMAQE